MFLLGRKRSGNKFTLISIVMIIVVIYVFKLISPQKEAEYPDTIHFDNLKYAYVETVKGFPTMFVRERTVSDEGYMILARRGIDTSEEVYIYEGYRKYRRYKVLKE